jgi:hypothetical protein
MNTHLLPLYDWYNVDVWIRRRAYHVFLLDTD